MRLVTKINLALVGVVAVSAILNFATLKMAVMPSFAALEEQAAERDHSRVLEAIQLQKDQVANSAGDYAMWDDTHDFVNGLAPSYREKNVTQESLQTLGVNYFVAVDMKGRIILDEGYDHSEDEPRPIKLFDSDMIPLSNKLLMAQNKVEVGSGLIRTKDGLVVVGYSPILRSDRTGERAGTLVLGRLLDIDALKLMTRVNFDLQDNLVPDNAVNSPSAATVDKIENLTGLGGDVVGRVITHTTKDITAVGTRTILTTSVFLLMSAGAVLVALGYVLHHIAIRRIQNLRSHIMNVASTGTLDVMPEDGKNDELSDTLSSFNQMATQLAELRDTLRRQDYDHGAADQAAGLLHNVRNAISPVSALAWELSSKDERGWKQNLKSAVDQLQDTSLPSDRVAKLHQFLAMSASRLIDEDRRRQDDMHSMVSMLRQIDDILKEQDSSAQLERVAENIDVTKALLVASELVKRRNGIILDSAGLEAVSARGHKVPLEQVLSNLLVNAAESIEASENQNGHIRIRTSATSSNEVEIVISDNGIGINKDVCSRVFEKGFSTKPGGKRGLGLHWCSNAIDAMGGRLELESEGLGKGATFRITLPTEQAKRVAA